MIKFTRPDGSPFYLFKAWVQCVSPADKTLNPNANTLITLSGVNLAVSEELEVVVDRLEN